MRQVTAAPDRMMRRGASVVAAVALAAAVGFVLRFDPTDRVADPTGPCLWHSLTGINGPGCGGTRMFYYLLHGELAEAARHHLAALVVVPFVAYLGVRFLASAWLGRELPALRLPPWIYGAYIAFFMLYSTVLRNLPWMPFSWFDIPNLTP
ncbi:DUF2752 domain-containing protein [Micromonospora peucetia]|uniref:DUF2752 domain-containing protein n=1 Tax=Micromonospora peucetia TaxID=47871 RepID=A0ABZ1EF30_9ACTN|nr:DUF2752 domain-containing protein [Micromonospora peucetia]WSA32389.1 DUF2752 domain-containing protein [Micromonospora peucetia]